MKTPIQDLHELIEQRVALFVNEAPAKHPMTVGADFRIRVADWFLAAYGVVNAWSGLHQPIVVHVGNLRGSFHATGVASAPDVRHGCVEYTVNGYIQLEESSMSESALEVEFREGCPSVDHVEAALRLGLCWNRRSRSERYRFVVNHGVVCADFPPLAKDAVMTPYNRFIDLTSPQLWRPFDKDSKPVAWSVLDDEVARFNTTATQPAPAPAAQPIKRFNVGDAVMCSTFSDGTAGVRIADPQDIARNLGVGKVEGCWQDHSRYQVRNLATDEVHVWPASALQGVDNWGLKVGDEVVTPRFVGYPTFVPSNMERFVDKIGVIERFSNNEVARVHGWAWPTYDVAVATARHRLKAAQVEAKAAAKQPEFRQLTRGIIEVRVYDNDADERSTLTNMLVEQGATDINIQRDSHGVLSATYKLPIKQSLSHIPQETTMPTINTGTTNGSTIDNPTTTTKKPSRGRLAIDAAKTRAPVELGLNRMHKIVAKKALKMFKGTRQEKAVVQRFLSDVLQSEYGKAFMGAAAATIVPYGASLPGLGKHADILDAVADELAKRSATVLAVELGGTLLDAVEPLIAIVTDMVAKTAEGSSSVEVVDMPAETARLSAPQQGSSPDFSNVASSMRCRTSA